MGEFLKEALALWGNRQKIRLLCADLGFFDDRLPSFFHATMLHLPGIDHERLTHRYTGRDYRLTGVFGNVVRESLS